MENAARRWLALGEALGDDAAQLQAATWILISCYARARPAAADLDRFAAVLSVDPERLDLRGRRRLTVNGAWCESDAAGIRAGALYASAWLWAIGIQLDAIADELPADTPVGLSDEAQCLAAESRDPYIADEVLDARGYALSAGPDVHDLLAAAQRAQARGFTRGGGAAMQLGGALLRLGRLDDLTALTEEMDRVGEERADRGMVALADVWRAAEALARGRLDDARAATEMVLETLPEDPGWQLIYHVLTCFRMLAEGRADEASEPADLLAANPMFDYSHLPAVVAIAQGDPGPAAAVLSDWRAAGGSIPIGSGWSPRVWGLAECARATRDRAAAEQLYPLLLPYDGQLLDWFWIFAHASAAYTLGVLAETLGDHDRALAHYARALAFEESCGAETLAARTRQALARIG